MSNVISFDKARKQKRDAGRKRILCLEGHHKWVISQRKPFENKQGKLVTEYSCHYCGKAKTELS